MKTWAAIPEYEGIYEASSDGEIRRIAHIPHARKAPYTLRPLGHPGGYIMVALHKDKKQRHRLIHRLVMAAFRGPSNLEVNHKNGNKKDNRLENLEYVTPKQNGEHSSRMGLVPSGTRIPWAKLDPDKVREIRARHAAGESGLKIAARFQMHPMNVYHVINRKTWKQVL